jgi:DNA-binding response OmpR family regulator
MGDRGFESISLQRRVRCEPAPSGTTYDHLERLQASGEHYLLKPFKVRHLTALADKVLTEIAAQCVRRKRSDGSFFASRTG